MVSPRFPVFRMYKFFVIPMRLRMAPVKKCLSLQRLLISKYDIAIVAKNSFCSFKVIFRKTRVSLLL